MEKLLNKIITIAKRIFSVQNEQKLLKFIAFLKFKSVSLFKRYRLNRFKSRLAPKQIGLLVLIVIILLIVVIRWRQNALFAQRLRVTKELQSLYFDPVTLLSVIEKQDKHYLLVDIRSNGEYINSHLKNAINIEAAKLNEKEIITKYLNQEKRAKTIILYGYLPNSSLMFKTAEAFWQARINARILSVSYNQFRNGFYEWYPGAELGGVNLEKYVDKQKL